MDEKAHQERMAPYDAVIDEILRDYPQITVYDPRPLFCKEGECRASDGVLPYYMDGDHVNHHGASMVIDDFLSKGFLNPTTPPKKH